MTARYFVPTPDVMDAEHFVRIAVQDLAKARAVAEYAKRGEKPDGALLEHIEAEVDRFFGWQHVHTEGHEVFDLNTMKLQPAP